jgi:hypothetical protein
VLAGSIRRELDILKRYVDNTAARHCLHRVQDEIVHHLGDLVRVDVGRPRTIAHVESGATGER